MMNLTRFPLIAALMASALFATAMAQTPPAPATPPLAVVQEEPSLSVPTVPAPSPATGPQVPQQIDIKDSHLQAARDLISASRIIDAFEGLLPNIIQQVGLTLTGQNLAVQADLKKRTALTESLKTVEEGFAADRERLYAQIALIYAARFSEAELRKIVEFLRSAEGQKFATVSPLVAQDSFRIANGWAERVGQEAFEKVRAEMRKRGQPL